MIQDDPINYTKPSSSSISAAPPCGYFRVNSVDSTEEQQDLEQKQQKHDHICVQNITVDINTEGDNKSSSQTKASAINRTADESVSTTQLYFKICMLIDVLQGIPLGLVFGSIPYILKSMKSNTLSYSQFGLFSLAGYPYSLKLFWSPLVDQIYSLRIGRRKSWILPVQLLVAALFFFIGRRIDFWIVPGQTDFWKLNASFFTFVTLCATLDVAVDGWALTILPPNKIHFASTCQSVGVNIGLFISFTIFLALSSEKFCQQFLQMEGRETGLFTLGSFMKFWSFVYVLATIGLALKRETLPESLRLRLKSSNASTAQTILKAYKTLWEIVKLPSMRSFALILLSFKFGFSAYDAVAPLKLLEKGFPKEFLALTVLIDFPFQMVMGFFVGKWSSGSKTFKPWIIATYCRIIMSFVGLFVISKFPQSGSPSPSYTATLILTTILTSFCHTTMFISLGAYFIKISDPKYGGTYLTLLNTLSNFAGMWPKLPVMSAVDLMTIKRCSMEKESLSSLLSHQTLTPFSSIQKHQVSKCVGSFGVETCVSNGGRCEVEADGFYFVASFCLIIGLILFQFWIKPAVRRLETVPKSMWTVNSASTACMNDKENDNNKNEENNEQEKQHINIK